MGGLIVIGGGAAGFFGAIQAAEHKAFGDIVILEKTSKLLSKVRVSGGGRCNVTHDCLNPFELAGHYPRGEKQLKQIFKVFNAEHMVKWLQDKGVKLKTEVDRRMFPETDSSETIIECFLEQARIHRIKIESGCEVVRVVRATEHFKISTTKGEYYATCVLVATGGSPKPAFYSLISDLEHTIASPIPSLFTFNDSEKDFVNLMGVSVPNAQVKIASTKFSQTGPLLITHWGLSGPAVIKLSAWAATWLNECNYEFTVLVSWLGPANEDTTRTSLLNLKATKPKQRIRSNTLAGIPGRLWEKLCDRADIDDSGLWGELPNRSLNKLLENLIRCPFKIKGKTTFKEEFVTCGGVSLDQINLETMESRLVPGLFFAGEVLNIDGETGGFNFQSAWSTAFVAARSIAKQLGEKSNA